MKWFVPAIIIGLVGGMFDEFTDLHKIWCFLIGIAAFFLFILVKSVIQTARTMKETKGRKKIWLDQDNNTHEGI